MLNCTLKTILKNRIFGTLALAAVAIFPLGLGCAQEVSHTESDKPGFFGGHTHEETTVTKNPDGSLNTEHQKQSTNP